MGGAREDMKDRFLTTEICSTAGAGGSREGREEQASGRIVRRVKRTQSLFVLRGRLVCVRAAPCRHWTIMAFQGSTGGDGLLEFGMVDVSLVRWWLVVRMLRVWET